MKIKNTAILTLAAAGLLWSTGAKAQSIFTYNTGDLLLGFRTSGASDLVVDIGSASLYTGATGQIQISGNYYTSTQFSDASLDINNLFFSVFGESGLPTRNLWVSQAGGGNGWTAHNVFSQGPTAGVMEGIANGAQDISSQESASADNTASAVIVPATYSSGGDVSYTIGVGTSGNLQGYFQGDIENNTSAGFSSGSTPDVLSLYELDSANAGQAGNLVGNFTLYNDGDLVFTPVPEPASYAMFGLGALLLTAVRKFRRTA